MRRRRAGKAGRQAGSRLRHKYVYMSILHHRVHAAGRERDSPTQGRTAQADHIIIHININHIEHIYPAPEFSQ